MDDFFAALALAIIIEGLLYAAFPEQMKAMIAQVLAMDTGQLRWVALTISAVGLAMLVVVRGFQA